MTSLAEFVGLLFMAYTVYAVVSSVWNLLYTCYLGKILGRSIDVRKLGSWAVVTGATDGLGFCYAEEMARKGLNVVLISRSLLKLQSVARDLEERFGVTTKVIDVDFTGGPEIYERIGECLRDLDVGVLINNVGMSYPYPEFLGFLPDGNKFCVDLLNCNVLSVTKMTFLVLPKMMDKRCGLILNVGSVSAVLPTPLLTLYSSSKAFVNKFSQDLAYECRPFGVTVQCVLPGFVATNLSRIRKATLTVPSPEEFVRMHMNTLGLEVSSPGYWVHKIQHGMYQFFLVFFRVIIESFSWYGMLSVRARNIRRRQQEGKFDESMKFMGDYHNTLAEAVVGTHNSDD